MKTTYTLFLAIFAPILLAACASMQPQTSTSNALDLPARFQGKLPCADCAGIRYVLNLYADHTYGMEMTYLGTPESFTRHFEAGQWTLDGTTLTLDPSLGSSTNQWRLTSNQTLTALAADGQPPDTQLNYTLQRTGKPVSRSLEGTYWRLIQLDGDKLTGDDLMREPHIVLHAKKQRVSGANGCNRLMGGYSQKGNSLRFSKLATTMMACPGQSMDIAQSFGKTLSHVRSYRILGNYLVVRDAHGNRLAAFRATDMQ